MTRSALSSGLTQTHECTVNCLMDWKSGRVGKPMSHPTVNESIAWTILMLKNPWPFPYLVALYSVACGWL